MMKNTKIPTTCVLDMGNENPYTTILIDLCLVLCITRKMIDDGMSLFLRFPFGNRFLYMVSMDESKVITTYSHM